MKAKVKEAKDSIKLSTVVPVVVGMAVFGLVVYVAVRTGLGPLKQAAKVAKGG